MSAVCNVERSILGKTVFRNGLASLRKVALRWRRLSLCVVAVLSWPQPSTAQHNSSTQPDLKELSRDELKACLANPKACGAADLYAISDELVRRLPELPTEVLLECFDDGSPCGVWEDSASGWPISDELARRSGPHDLLVRYWNEPNWAIRDGIEHVAYHFDSEEVTSFMREVMAKDVDDGEDSYWPINYMAKKGDTEALRQLASGRYRGQGCMQYATSVRLFGKWKYRPAIPYLTGTALHDACLNIVIEAEASLRTMYPDSPQFDRLREMQRYFCGRAKDEGFRVKCASK